MNDLSHILALLDGGPQGAGVGAPGPRRARGQVFTPPRLAEAVCRLAVTATTRAVLDPAAGDGAILRAAGALAPRARLLGIERDRALARACAAAVPGVRVVTGEALLGTAAVPPVDAVVGNPPFVRSIRLRASDPVLWSALRGRFHATAHGEWDLYGAFLEKSFDWLRPDGVAAWIVPSRWLTARWAARLRGELAARRAARLVIDLGARQVFTAATTYTSIVVLGASPVAAPMRLIRARDPGWSEAVVDTAALGDAPWRPSPPRRRRRGATLGEVAHIVKGTGTNADGVFVLPRARRDGAWLVADEVRIEAAAARPCWRGRDVGGAGGAWCIVPYDGRALLPWDEVRRRWPRAAAYLEAHRGRLEARERGRFTGPRFHAFGRPQNLEFLLDPAPKVIVPDVVRAPRATVDATGALVLDSAYALRPRADAPPRWRSIAALHELMVSPALAAWLADASVPLRGDYRRIKTAYLAPMPLP